MAENTEQYVAAIKSADALRDEGNFERAVEIYTNLLETRPRGIIFLMRGTTYCEWKRFELAVPDLTKTIELDDSNHDEAFANRGNAYLHLREYELAAHDFSKVIELLAWAVAAAFGGRGIANWKRRRIDEAIRDLSIACDLDESNANPRFNLAALLHEAGRIDEAAVYIEQAARIEPKDVQIIALRGEVNESLEKKRSES